MEGEWEPEQRTETLAIGTQWTVMPASEIISRSLLESHTDCSLSPCGPTWPSVRSQCSCSRPQSPLGQSSCKRIALTVRRQGRTCGHHKGFYDWSYSITLGPGHRISIRREWGGPLVPKRPMISNCSNTKPIILMARSSRSGLNGWFWAEFSSSPN